MGPYKKYSNGYQCHSIDGDTGEIITSHFCTNELYAKQDLGYMGNCHFSKAKNKLYGEKYPYGYELIWIGDYSNNDMIKSLLNNG